MHRNLSRTTMFGLFIALALMPVVSAGQLKGLATRMTANFYLRFDRNVPAEDIRRIGKQLEHAYAEYRGRLGASFRRKIDVYAFSSAGRYRSESRSVVYDDADIRDGKIFLYVPAVLASDTALRNPAARVVSESILEEFKWCPKWLAEVYGIYAGMDLSRFGSPAQLTASTFSDLTEDYARAEHLKDLNEIRAKLAATARFLIDRYGERRTERLYLQFQQPVTLEEAFEAAFGEKMPVIEKAWAAALRSPPKG